MDSFRRAIIPTNFDQIRSYSFQPYINQDTKLKSFSNRPEINYAQNTAWKQFLEKPKWNFVADQKIEFFPNLKSDFEKSKSTNLTLEYESKSHIQESKSYSSDKSMFMPESKSDHSQISKSNFHDSKSITYEKSDSNLVQFSKSNAIVGQMDSIFVENSKLIVDEELKSEDQSETEKTTISKLSAAKWQKPDKSYVFLIQEAIQESTDGKLRLASIYSYLEEKYPYFKQLTGKERRSWQNSVRHNLSLNKCFIRLTPKDGSLNGHDRKGSYWMLDEDCVDQFEPGNCKRRRRMKRSTKSDGTMFTDPIFTWGQNQWASLQNLMSTNAMGQVAADCFNPTPPTNNYSTALVPLTTLPTHLSTPALYPSNPGYTTASLSQNQIACTSGYPYKLPAAGTLMNTTKTNSSANGIFPVGGYYYPTSFQLPPPSYEANSATF